MQLLLTSRKLKPNAPNKTKKEENLRMAKLKRDKNLKKMKRMLIKNLQEKKESGNQLNIYHLKLKKFSMLYALTQWAKIDGTVKMKNFRL